MALSPKEIIALRDPDTANLAAFQGVVDGLVDIASIQTSTTAFGDERNLAIALLVLHWEYMRRRSGASTEVTGVGDGPSRRDFARPASATRSKPLELTSWGMELQALQHRNILAVRNRMTA
jgi:hypothetical protein